jgi:hypothetical protein
MTSAIHAALMRGGDCVKLALLPLRKATLQKTLQDAMRMLNKPAAAVPAAAASPGPATPAQPRSFGVGERAASAVQSHGRLVCE